MAYAGGNRGDGRAVGCLGATVVRGVVRWGAFALALANASLHAGEYCGPDLTEWLLYEMNTNAATEEVAQLYASRFPSTPKGTAERMHQFAGLVGPGKQWDHKGPILDLLDESLAEGPCPTQQCSRTITLCGACYSYDVFSNIHYGYIGSVAGFIAPVLIAAPAVVQEGGDTPIEKIILEAEDTPAVTTGIEVHRRLWWYRLFFPQQNPWPGVVTRQMLCTAVERRSAQLSARFVGPACRACAESWIPEGGHEPQ